MTIAELITELQRYPGALQAQVFVDWPDDIEESSGWFEIDKVRPCVGGVQIELEQ